MKTSIKRILVPLDPSIYAQAATETACLIARRHNGSVTGVAVLDSAEIRSSLVPAIGPYYPMMIEAVQAKLKHADKTLHDCMARFSKTCEEAGVAHSETEYEGIPAKKLLESSIFHDLVVAGLETSFHFETRGGPGDSLEKVLDRTITPVLAVTAEGLGDVNQVLITFDGSIGAARALHDFAAFADPFNPDVVVAVSGEPEKTAFLARNAMAFLRSHGIENVDSIESETPIEELVNDAMLEEYDLVVAGIHSKKIIKDYFIGSFTRQLIESRKTNLFLSH
ncbi:MAG: universal stress protein [Verrucomicrobiales bacterium]|nr:universal stress protein [Verrucomicrobiales bacterium]